MNFNIDIAIVIGFLIINLVVGLYYSRSVNNLTDYALGGRKFSSGTLAATIAATWIGGGVFGQTLAETYKQGFYFMIPALGDSLVLLVVGVFLVPRMQGFLGNLSIADTMGKIYGKKARLITAFISLLSCIGVIAAQFKVASTLLELFFGISSFYAVLLAALIVITYSSLGGIRAVSFTDVTQIFTFGCIVPIVSLIMWQTLNNPYNIFDVISENPNFNFQEVFTIRNAKLIDAFLLFLFFVIPTLEPTTFQRLVMAKDVNQAKKSVILASLICISISIITMWVAVLLFYENANLNPENLLSYIINNYSYTGLKGLIAIGIMSIVMSTADSYMNSASILFVNDFLKPIGYAFSQKKELLISKICCIILGSIAFFMAFKTESLLELTYLVWGSYMPIITVPLTLAILGFRLTSKAVLSGMFAGFSTIIIFEIINVGIKSVIPAMLANLLFSVASNYFYGESSIYSYNNREVDENKVKKSNNFFCSIVQNIREFNILKFCNKGLPDSSAIYSYFSGALFLTIITTMSISENRYDHLDLINALQLFVLVIATSFLCTNYWPSIFKDKYMGVIWYLSIFLGLIFISSFLVLMSKFSHASLTILTIHLVFACMLVGWRTSLVMIPVGLWLSFFLYKNFIGKMTPEGIYDLKIKLIYVLLIVFGFATTILKSKQEQEKSTEAKVNTLETEVSDLNEKVVHYSERISDQAKEIERLGATAQRIINNVNHELRLPVGNVMNFAEMLNEGLGKYSEEQLKNLSDEVYKNSNRLSSMIMNMLDLAALNAKKLELDKKLINLGELVEDRVNNCRKIYLDDKKIDFVMKINPEILVLVDPNYMRQVVDNLVINAIKFSSEGIIRVELLKKGGLIEFTIEDNGIGIPKEELYDIFTPFKMGSNAESKAEGRGVGLALCKAAVEAHGGTISAESKDEKGARFRFVLE